MSSVDLADLQKYIEDNIGTFHQKKIENILTLKLTNILKRKNIYLFKAKNILTSEQLVKTLLDAYLSSQEETLFGELLEGLAIFINSKIYGGKKSSAEGIDLEFDKENIHYLVSIKSGPNWGNSRQIKKMKDDFEKAKKILRSNRSSIPQIITVNGCCYGKSTTQNIDKGSYYKYCGQKFWDFISDDPNLYITIIEPMGHEARKKTDEFDENYAKVIHRFSKDFMNKFCTDDKIDWEALVRFNSQYIDHKKEERE